MIDDLFDYLEEIRDRRFEWGKHDCFTFTNQAWQRMYNKPWADSNWYGTYLDPYGLPFTTHELQARFPAYASISAAVDTRLTPCHSPPPRGALVASYAGEGRWKLGTAFGIAVGTCAAFLGQRGVRYVDIEYVTHSWINRT